MLGYDAYSLTICVKHVEELGLRCRRHGHSAFVNTGMQLASPHSKRFELSIQCDPAVASWAFAETANMTIDRDGSYSIDNSQLCPLYGEHDNVLRHERPEDLFEHIAAWLKWTRQAQDI